MNKKNKNKTTTQINRSRIFKCAWAYLKSGFASDLSQSLTRAWAWAKKTFWPIKSASHKTKQDTIRAISEYEKKLFKNPGYCYKSDKKPNTSSSSHISNFIGNLNFY